MQTLEPDTVVEIMEETIDVDVAIEDITMDNTFTDDKEYKVIRRDAQITVFDRNKIVMAMSKAFLAEEGELAESSRRIHDTVNELAQSVVEALVRRQSNGGIFHIEDIQDQVELALMRSGHHRVARAYVLYREEHARKRAKEKHRSKQLSVIHIMDENGNKKLLDQQRLEQLFQEACVNLENVDAEKLYQDARHHLFDGMSEKDVARLLVMTARTLIEKEPNYSFVAARLLLDDLRKEAVSFVFGQTCSYLHTEMTKAYAEYFQQYIYKAIDLQRLDPILAEYDLVRLGAAIKPEGDIAFTYLGLQTLYDRYFIHEGDIRFELPQAFFMRIAMGLAINEIDREYWAIQFYQLLSSFDFMSSTPTLFNSGTLRPQLSSCYLTTVPDDLSGIYNAMRDNALLSKYAGGLGNDWTCVRGMGAHIKGTNGKSQGVVPFLKVANDTALAVNQGGKRKGAMCAYLETWHIDIEEFLELRKNTGDERRRTHDMNTANWIPDLFMQRVIEEGEWTLFSPDETPDLHENYGEAFDTLYLQYEEKARRGAMQVYKVISAVGLWRKMLGMLFETGHPWITFKDPCNIRSPQQHQGVVHSSNLCTEITLNTSEKEIAVCNLGSINLPAHVNQDGLDVAKLEKTIHVAMRMLDNVVDYNFYSVPQARISNLRHRPVGLGIMGFQDALYKQRIAYMSDAAVEFADQSMEMISYYSIQASTDLAQERGSYSSFKDSLWHKGILPIDSLNLLQKSRKADYFQVNQEQRLDWESLRERVKTVGMRNSNTMAIAPTATISNICGVSQSIEPTYQNIFVKSNLSGEFTVINTYLVADLKAIGLWDEVMINDLKYYDGSIQEIDRIPEALKILYKTAFEIDPCWLVEAASRRQKWIDQGQSLNLYMADANGKKLDHLYKLAWVRGLKTTYYLRSIGATHVEKSTLTNNNLADQALNLSDAEQTAPKVCSIYDPDCEACQ